MRVYIPSTFDALVTLADTGSLPVVAGRAFTATPTLIDAFEGCDLEEVEHFAFLDAAEASLRLLTQPSSMHPHRRVVVSADVAPEAARIDDSLGDSVVVLSEQSLPLSELRAIHVDLPAAEELVRSGIEAIDASDLGDEDAAHVVLQVQDQYLAFYAPEELGLLVDLG